MLSTTSIHPFLHRAELIHSEQTVIQAIHRLADEITRVLSQQNPLVLCVMSGAVVFTGHLLPRLSFPLDFDYVQVSRYRKQTTGNQLHWRVAPQENLHDRVVLVLDDILDEGITLAAIRDQVLKSGAKAFYSAVLAEKTLSSAKPITADFVGLTVPDRFVFGFGMDIRGTWRNLSAIYAMTD